MKCTIPEISWHNRDPVLSVDVQPVLNTDIYRLASAGTDSHVLIWHLRILETGATSVEPVSDLTRHQRAVNVVRWSPSGQYLASGDDDANIIVWQQKADELSTMLDGETADKEKWSVYKVLRGHKEDVYDISWSPNSLKLLSGSVDNTAIIWDLAKGNNDNILSDHKGFVQGVSWDPQGQFLATLSSDRMCRIFTDTGKQVRCRMSKGCLNLPEGHALHGQVVRYYHDDTLKSFFRRLAFTPDGNLLVTPAGCLDSGQNNKPLYTTYIYNCNSFSQPAAILPSPGQYTVAVRCCPMLFELRTDGSDPSVALPYRIIIAVATRSSVVLYDTQQLSPFAVISNIHYTRLTDLTWSSDGRILAVSSTDGFCSLVTFEPNELGTEYIKEDSDEENMEQSVCEENIESVIEDKPDEVKEEKKRSSFLKQWAMKKNTIDNKKAANSDSKRDIIQIDDSPPKNPIDSTPKPIAVKRKPQTETIKPIAVRKKPKDQDITNSPKISTPNTKKKLETETPNSPTSKNITQAKPIAVRRKPRDQMDITQFLKSPSEPPTKKVALDNKKDLKSITDTPKKSKKFDKSDPQIITSEDSVAQDAWTCKMETTESKNSDVIIIEDSQSQDDIQLIEEESEDFKLVLEETLDDCEKQQSRSLEDFEKFYEKNNEDIQETKNEESKKTSDQEIHKKNDTSSEDKEQKEENSEDNPTKGATKDGEQNEATKAEASEQKNEVTKKEENENKDTQKTENYPCDEQKVTKSENTEQKNEVTGCDSKSVNVDRISTKCDVETNSEKSSIVNDIKNKINDLQIQPGGRKKVPFITLSSPKSKKKNS